MSPKHFHDFFAPIDGVALRFQMRCVDGRPREILVAAPLRAQIGRRRGQALAAQMDLVNHLLIDMPWSLMSCSRGAGNIGAILEAAEARRAEIYGPLAEAA